MEKKENNQSKSKEPMTLKKLMKYAEEYAYYAAGFKKEKPKID